MDTDNGATDKVEPSPVSPSEPPLPPTENETSGPADALGPTVEADDGTSWSPPKVEPETGIAIDGHGLPINHRLRAERLADAGEEEDPAGEISPAHIADAKERLEGQRAADEELAAAEAKRNPPVDTSMTVKALQGIADKQGIDISSASNNDERVAMIEAARANGTARAANEEVA